MPQSREKHTSHYVWFEFDGESSDAPFKEEDRARRFAGFLERNGLAVEGVEDRLHPYKREDDEVIERCCHVVFFRYAGVERPAHFDDRNLAEEFANFLQNEGLFVFTVLEEQFKF